MSTLDSQIYRATNQFDILLNSKIYYKLDKIRRDSLFWIKI